MAQSQTKTYDGTLLGENLVSIQANGGAVAIQIEHAPDVWVTSDTISEDTAVLVYCGGAVMRFVPSGGATFTVHS